MSNERRKNLVKIMVFGTFDGLHRGHLSFFRQAKKLHQNSYLIVSIGRDKNVRKIKNFTPGQGERERLRLVKKSGIPDKVVLGGLRHHLLHILKERPEMIALGYDQRAYVKGLKNDLKKRGLSVKIVRLRSYRPNIYKNRLLRKRSV